MTTPPLLLGASLLFWGWQTGFLIVGLGMAILLEGSRLVKRRFDFSLPEFNRISDLCALLILFMMAYRYYAATAPMTRWVPMAFFPLLAAQAYSTIERIPLGAIFWTYRKRARGAETQKAFDGSYYFLAVNLLAASAGNQRAIWFYLGLLFLTAWALWSFRSKRLAVYSWAGLLLLAGAIGYFAQFGIHYLQLWVENQAVEWLFSSEEFDPYRAKTAIGDIDSLKLSSRILFRVGADFRAAQGLRLREASYNIYRSSQWLASRSVFKALSAKPDGTSWSLGPKPSTDRRLTVFASLEKGQGLLKLPAGAWQIEGLPAQRLEQNQYGATKILEGPGLVSYIVHYGQDASSDSPPTAQDLLVPDGEKQAISKALARLAVTGQDGPEALRRISDFFQGEFKYSLDRSHPASSGNPLENFLFVTRAGHCEYFATATVLLLRAAGIPARYATGYLLDDYSPREEKFLVRSRHAHAWALAYLDGVWLDFDTTPSGWADFEAESTPIWQPLADLVSWIAFKLAEWRWAEGGVGGKLIWMLVIPLILILGRNLFFKKRRLLRKEKPPVVPEEISRIGVDSPFYHIEKKMAEVGFLRGPAENLSAWVHRIELARPDLSGLEPLGPILALHHRLRFDPLGLSPTEEMELKVKVHKWLEYSKTIAV